MKKWISLMSVFLIIAAINMSVAACTNKTSSSTTTTLSTTQITTTSSTPSFTANVSTKSGIGTYLVDGNGKTLYWTTLDSTGQSNVTGAVLANWPIFYTPNITVPSLLRLSDFGSITRADGTKQTTFKGWPIYYYFNDRASGDTLGQGINGVWFAVNPTASGPTPVVTTAQTTTTYPTTTTVISSPTTTPTSTTTTTTTPITTTTTTTAIPGY